MVQSFLESKVRHVKKRLMMPHRLFIALMVVAEALCILLAIAFNAYNARTLQNAEKVRLASLCDSTTAQIDAMVHDMDEVSIAIMTADGFVPAMKRLSLDEPEDSYTAALRSIMSKAYVRKTHVYRIVVLSGNGNSVSLGRNELTRPEIQALVTDGYWHETDRRGSSKVLVGPMNDPWVKAEPQSIFSLLRAVREGDQLLGYVEIQMQCKRITETFHSWTRYGNLYYAIVDGGGRLFLSNIGPEQYELYMDTIIQNAAWYPTDSLETQEALISITSSNYTDWKTAVVMPKSVLFAPIGNALPIAIAFSVLVGLVIAFFFKLIVDRITKPIQKVVGQVQQLNLSNLDAPFMQVSGSYESELLSQAFETMKTRLNESFKQEKALEHLQTKVLLEGLQLRIGPHFLNNTLASIANMCESGDAQNAAEACFSLSDLLRYSSSPAKSLVTISEEMEHLNSYLMLMKGRYRHRLNYTVETDAQCLRRRIMKLTIQPIVENAIKYSLCESEEVHVDIRVYSKAEETIVSVSDNGVGFNEQVLSQLRGTITQFLSDPVRFSMNEFAPRRGFGLAGTLMRQYLLLGEQGFRYDISNHAEGGATVTLYMTAAEVK